MNIQFNYILIAAIISFFLYRYIRSYKVRKMLPELLKNSAMIVDVRSAAEFMSGGNDKSINIPLHEIDSKLHKLSKDKPIVLCCATGARSATAAVILRKNGFSNVVNAGSWRNTLQ